MKRRDGVVLLAVGLGLLVFSVVWTGAGLGRLLLVRLASAEDGGFGEDEYASGEVDVIMEGRVGYIGLLMHEEDDVLDMSLEDFDIEWDTVVVNDTGIYLSSGELFDLGDEKATNETAETPAGAFFPLFGVEKKDYTIADTITGTPVIARYAGVDRVLGEGVYVYHTETETIEDGDMPLSQRSTVIYYIHPRTSIPLDIRTEISAKILFPDFRLLMAGETSVYSYFTTTPVSSGTPLGEENMEVLAEVSTTSELMDDPMLAIFVETTTYYSTDTGEPLPPEEQPPQEVYVVNRASYEYVTGMDGTKRSGMHTFPLGSLEKQQYMLWNTVALEAVSTDFVKEMYLHGELVWLFESCVDNATVGGQPPFLPGGVLGSEYTVTMWTRYYLHPRSSLPLMVETEGLVYVRSSTGMGTGQLVSQFNSTTDEDFFLDMQRIATLYTDVLLPLSGSTITAFSISLHFSHGFSRTMLDAVRLVESTLRFLDVTLPTIMLVIGVLMVVLGKRRRRRWQEMDARPPLIQTLAHPPSTNQKS